MDRLETVETFRDRLKEVIMRSGLSRSAFAAELGIDRSTLSQLLSSGNDRLPRAETIVAIAAREQVSIDWLLGLSQEGQLFTDFLSTALEIEDTSGSPLDERLVAWSAEAIGYKIRYVPSTLPDLLKISDIFRYEYQDYGTFARKVNIAQAESSLAHTRRPETDMETCSSLQSVEEFVLGHGIWKGLAPESRRRQLERMIELTDELYPTFRWFLFDGLESYSVPLTIYGPQRAMIYAGKMFLVFNSTEHIRELINHFDRLIRAAVVQPPDVPEFLRQLLPKTKTAS